MGNQITKLTNLRRPSFGFGSVTKINEIENENSVELSNEEEDGFVNVELRTSKNENVSENNHENGNQNKNETILNDSENEEILLNEENQNDSNDDSENLNESSIKNEISTNGTANGTKNVKTNGNSNYLTNGNGHAKNGHAKNGNSSNLVLDDTSSEKSEEITSKEFINETHEKNNLNIDFIINQDQYSKKNDKSIKDLEDEQEVEEEYEIQIKKKRGKRVSKPKQNKKRKGNTMLNDLHRYQELALEVDD